MPGMKNTRLAGYSVCARNCFAVGMFLLPIPAVSAPNFSGMSIEQLADVEVTSVSSREQSLDESGDINRGQLIPHSVYADTRLRF